MEVHLNQVWGDLNAEKYRPILGTIHSVKCLIGNNFPVNMVVIPKHIAKTVRVYRVFLDKEVDSGTQSVMYWLPRAWTSKKSFEMSFKKPGELFLNTTYVSSDCVKE